MAKEKTRDELLAKMRGSLGVETLDEESANPVVQQPVIQKPERTPVINETKKIKEEKEIKTRTTIALYPTLLRDMKRISYIKRESVSEILGLMIEKYIKSNQSALEEFESLPLQIQKKVDSSK